MKKRVTYKRFERNFQILIENVLHLDIRNEYYVGCQSWLDGKDIGMYYIELYFINNVKIRMEYVDKEIWIDILNIISKHI